MLKVTLALLTVVFTSLSVSPARADYNDQNCLDACLQDCGATCAGTAGSGKSVCVKTCGRENDECRASCVVPGDPPPPPPPPPTPPPRGLLCDAEDATHPGFFPLFRWAIGELIGQGRYRTQKACNEDGVFVAGLVGSLAAFVPGYWKIVVALGAFNHKTIMECVCAEFSW